MNWENLKNGEQSNVEFKLDIPEDQNKYLKTVVAFANGAGGELVFGIKNNTWEVVGFPEDRVFEKMDAITNSIYDACTPKIIPDVKIFDIEGKHVIIVKIYAGSQKPYYITKQGLQNGTYFRISGVTRKAENDTIQELYYEGLNQSFDQLPTHDEVSSDRASALCDQMYNHTPIYEDFQSRPKKRPITINQLLSWKIVIRKDDHYYATNAFHLLEGSSDAAIQCAVFKGTTRSIFLDRREITGPLASQVEEATLFVMKNIQLGSRIDNTVRKDFYELPIPSVREMIANAVCHRSYIRSEKIQVALYDDRLEITSPGRMDPELTVEELKDGRSKIRNKAIAQAFQYMHIIESWGSGIPRIYEEAQKYDLPQPKISLMGNAFRITFFRRSFETDQFGVIDPATRVENTHTIPIETKTHNNSIILTDKENEILSVLKVHPEFTQALLAKELNWTIDAVKYHIRKLQSKHLIEHIGSKKSGQWIIK